MAISPDVVHRSHCASRIGRQWSVFEAPDAFPRRGRRPRPGVFKLATEGQQLTRSISVIGTPHYLAPEKYESLRCAQRIIRQMKRKRHTVEEIIKKLREATGTIAGGKSAEEAARQIGVSVQTCHRWKEQYGGTDRNTINRLKELKHENSRLKKLVADQSLNNATLKELVRRVERSETDSIKCCPQDEAKPNQRGEPGAQTRGGGAPGAHRPCQNGRASAGRGLAAPLRPPVALHQDSRCDMTMALSLAREPTALSCATTASRKNRSEAEIARPKAARRASAARQYIAPYTPEQNGLCEPVHPHLQREMHLAAPL